MHDLDNHIRKLLSKGRPLLVSVFGYKKMSSDQIENHNCKPEKSVGKPNREFIQKFSDTKLMRKETEIHADRPIPSPLVPREPLQFCPRFINYSIPYLTLLRTLSSYPGIKYQMV